jgi:hypothetical protein
MSEVTCYSNKKFLKATLKNETGSPKVFYFALLSSHQIWLIPLVDDDLPIHLLDKFEETVYCLQFYDPLGPESPLD